MLGFAEVAHGDVTLTPTGVEFSQADVQRSRQIFGEQALAHVPILRTIVETLKQKKSGNAKADLFLDFLDEYYSEKEAERQFETAIAWGRYGQLLEYDSDEEVLSLPEPE
jgi:NitT/TauT family transport system ATP-binding protein